LDLRGALFEGGRDVGGTGQRGLQENVLRSLTGCKKLPVRELASMARACFWQPDNYFAYFAGTSGISDKGGIVES
jgi:hypothetical protein